MKIDLVSGALGAEVKGIDLKDSSEENWNVIEKFLKLNLNFKLDKLNATVSSDWIDNKGCLSTLPHKHDVGGMFAAKLIRI